MHTGSSVSVFGYNCLLKDLFSVMFCVIISYNIMLLYELDLQFYLVTKTIRRRL